jgi:hypothetical protein
MGYWFLMTGIFCAVEGQELICFLGNERNLSLGDGAGSVYDYYTAYIHSALTSSYVAATNSIHVPTDCLIAVLTATRL